MLAWAAHGAKMNVWRLKNSDTTHTPVPLLCIDTTETYCTNLLTEI